MVKIKSVLHILTLCIAVVGYLPLMPYLQPFARFFFPAALLVSLYLQRKDSAISGRVLTPLAVALFFFQASGFSVGNIVQVTADLLVVFLGIRLLGERSGRNYLQAFALALFCLASSSLYNLSALFLIYLLVLMLLLAVSLVVLTFHAHDAELSLERREATKVLTVSVLMPVVSLPLLLFLFVLLPRTQYPLWDFLNSSGRTTTGFTDTVRPGSSSSVNEVKNVVLRVVSPAVPEQKLYWRGIVLNAFKENAWVRIPPSQEITTPSLPGPVLNQEIYPEPSRSPYLLTLNFPRDVSGVRYHLFGDRVLTLVRAPEKRIKYEVESVLADAIPEKGAIDRRFYLALPSHVPQRLRAKGLELAASGGGEAEKLRLVERFFRAQKLSYATSGLPVGPDALDSFLFDKKRGHCELFATACATLLRLAGVPARLVGGYHGGVYNEMGGYYLVSEDMAHVWVEAYDPLRGWVTVDPSGWSIGFARNEGWGKKLRMYLDALGFYWNRAVITYDLDKQVALFRTAGTKARNLSFPHAAWKPLAGIAAALCLAAALVAAWLSGPRSTQERVLKRFLRVAARRYPSSVTSGRGLFELAEEVGDPQVREFAAIYGNAVYRDRPLLPDETAKLEAIIRNLGQHPS